MRLKQHEKVQSKQIIFFYHFVNGLNWEWLYIIFEYPVYNGQWKFAVFFSNCHFQTIIRQNEIQHKNVNWYSITNIKIFGIETFFNQPNWRLQQIQWILIENENRSLYSISYKTLHICNYKRIHRAHHPEIQCVIKNCFQ